MVDAFNAGAVAEASQMAEEQVVAVFEKMRLFIIEFVKRLPDTAFENEKVVNQLKMDFVGHFDEHKIVKTD